MTIPPLISETIDQAGLSWTFTVPPDLPFFEGHFPGAPILPGVVVLAWLMTAAERFRGKPLEAVELVNVKFQLAILPGAELELTVTPKSGGVLQGVVRSAEGIHASALIPGQEG